jgi:hypothetical protein
VVCTEYEVCTSHIHRYIYDVLWIPHNHSSSLFSRIWPQALSQPPSFELPWVKVTWDGDSVYVCMLCAVRVSVPWSVVFIRLKHQSCSATSTYLLKVLEYVCRAFRTWCVLNNPSLSLRRILRILVSLYPPAIPVTSSLVSIKARLSHHPSDIVSGEYQSTPIISSK